MRKIALVAAFVFAVGFIGCSKQDPAKQAFPKTPEKTVAHVTKELSKGNAVVVWDALPKSYRKDINELASKASQKVDKEVWNKSFGVIKKASATLKSKKSLLLSLPHVEAMMNSPQAKQAGVSKEKFGVGIDSIVEFLDTIANSQLADIEKMKKFDGEKFLKTSGNSFLKAVIDKSKSNPKEDVKKTLAAIKTEVVKSGKKISKLKISAPNQPAQEVEFVKVESRWVPKEMADNWTKNIKTALQDIAKKPKMKEAEKKQVLAGIAMAEAFIAQIDAAETKEDLNKVLDPYIGMAAMLMMQTGQGSPMGMPGK